jgi:hypothetical protein
MEFLVENRLRLFTEIGSWDYILEGMRESHALVF